MMSEWCRCRSSREDSSSSRSDCGDAERTSAPRNQSHQHTAAKPHDGIRLGAAQHAVVRAAVGSATGRARPPPPRQFCPHLDHDPDHARVVGQSLSQPRARRVARRRVVEPRAIVAPSIGVARQRRQLERAKKGDLVLVVPRRVLEGRKEASTHATRLIAMVGVRRKPNKTTNKSTTNARSKQTNKQTTLIDQDS